MKKVHVTASGEYDVIIEKGILKSCGALIGGIFPKGKTVIVSDDKVYSIYGETVKKSLEDNGFLVESFVFPNGEASKNVSTYTQILEFLAKNQITRSDFIVALGGGVTGDMAGFSAATYLRGIKFVQIPTTFLAAIDSSVGGKTGVNLDAGKNLVGAFHQPSLVICDTDTFKTLDEKTFADGISEAIKYGMIKEPDLLEKLAGDFDI
ncbi:MAG: 3-dehydroquinate synthase, partial [Lachnospiraceae bacterium]|nr:3-dehydroquinate synthase [Lachnospiraceae bacterium]